MKKIPFFLLIALAVLLSNCRQNEPTAAQRTSLDVNALPKATPEQVEALVAQFIEAKEGAVIDIPEGFYDMQTQLILDKVNKVTIKGKGMYNTVISFKNIKAGGEGMKITGNAAVLEGFTVLDAPGDCIKAMHCDGITFRAVNTTWSHQDLSKSGTYGIYPVQCTNVLVENCEVSHSRDAGIYVGQSEKIVVKNNYVFENVAGIEIENCDDAEVYDNKAENNTAGILVFNLPGLQKAFGSRTKVYNNTIKENNHENFAIDSSDPSGQNGNAITMVPPGSGVIILAGNEVEVFNNQIINHKTASVLIASYQFTQLPIPNHPGWTPFTTNIAIHDNAIERPASSMPDTTKAFSRLIAATCKVTQDVVYDGVYDPGRAAANPKNPMNVCIREKKPDFRFTKFSLPPDGDLTKISFSNDLENFANCDGKAGK